MISTLVPVALGGALGASARLMMAQAVTRLAGDTPIPLAILSVNVLGSFLMGFCAAWAMARGLGGWAPFLMTGVLGGFTTFSAFSLETVALIERGALGAAAAYAALSVVLSVGALALGMAMVRGIAG